jgi:uncharacterized protein with beta-barrel porin domain
VSGPATINGSTFDPSVGSPTQIAALGQRFTAFTASGGVDGKFGPVTGNLGAAFSQYPFLSANLDYALSRAAASLNFATAPGVYDTLSGDIHSSLRSDLIQNAYDLEEAVAARLGAADCGADAPGQIVSYGEGLPTTKDGAVRIHRSWRSRSGAGPYDG